MYCIRSVKLGNATSWAVSGRIHSLMYRFFPTVQWKIGYLSREEIVDNITSIFLHIPNFCSEQEDRLREKLNWEAEQIERNNKIHNALEFDKSHLLSLTARASANKYHVELPEILDNDGGAGEIEETMMWFALSQVKSNVEDQAERERTRSNGSENGAHRSHLIETPIWMNNDWRLRWIRRMGRREAQIQILLYFLILSLPGPQPLHPESPEMSLQRERSHSLSVSLAEEAEGKQKAKCTGLGLNKGRVLSREVSMSFKSKNKAPTATTAATASFWLSESHPREQDKPTKHEPSVTVLVEATPSKPVRTVSMSQVHIADSTTILVEATPVKSPAWKRWRRRRDLESSSPDIFMLTPGKGARADEPFIDDDAKWTVSTPTKSKSVNISITGSGASASDRLAYHYSEFHESHLSLFLTIKIELSFVVKHCFLKMEEPTERSLSRGWQLTSCGQGGMLVSIPDHRRVLTILPSPDAENRYQSRQGFINRKRRSRTGKVLSLSHNGNMVEGFINHHATAQTSKDNKSDCIVDAATPNCSTTAATSIAFPANYSFSYTAGGIYQALGSSKGRTFSFIKNSPPIDPPNVGSDGSRLYIIYWGLNDLDMVTWEWEGSEGSIGAKEATAGLSDAVYKRFNGVEQGEAAYEECQMTGVLAALKNKMDNERFILIKGERPGVYTRWYAIFLLLGSRLK
ncbi:hypothetical protein BDP27DRAFT_1505328 [Rhodocollybia butyracea]|uniref:Uncharacterized protein n=1 Tax=Rhodocollybia butyracea TaxID=206335 RepID=A0A9P5TY34_9AGAR|nr:hypothetical protein BDP27DRAFT_1505328 [Rhodocollybia butyracea]